MFLSRNGSHATRPPGDLWVARERRGPITKSANVLLYGIRLPVGRSGVPPFTVLFSLFTTRRLGRLPVAGDPLMRCPGADGRSGPDP